MAEESLIPTDHDDPAYSQCPYCQCNVDNETTQCPECGGFFPALRHRKGEVGWGAVCGLVRGLFIVAVFATVGNIVNLFYEPIHFFDFLLIVAGLIAAVSLNSIARRCHQRAYHVE